MTSLASFLPPADRESVLRAEGETQLAEIDAKYSAVLCELEHRLRWGVRFGFHMAVNMKRNLPLEMPLQREDENSLERLLDKVDIAQVAGRIARNMAAWAHDAGEMDMMLRDLSNRPEHVGLEIEQAHGWLKKGRGKRAPGLAI